jgi:hypothetical protein
MLLQQSNIAKLLRRLLNNIKLKNFRQSLIEILFENFNQALTGLVENSGIEPLTSSGRLPVPNGTSASACGATKAKQLAFALRSSRAKHAGANQTLLA